MKHNTLFHYIHSQSRTIPTQGNPLTKNTSLKKGAERHNSSSLGILRTMMTHSPSEHPPPSQTIICEEKGRRPPTKDEAFPIPSHLMGFHFLGMGINIKVHFPVSRRFSHNVRAVIIVCAHLLEGLPPQEMENVKWTPRL